MASSGIRSLLLPASLFTLVLAIATPSPYPNPNAVVPREPVITPSSVESIPTRTYNHKRDIFDSVESVAGSILSNLGSDIPSFVASGIPNFFQGFPTGDSVQSSLGLDDAQVSALPTQVLNIDPYANFTDEGWNVRFHGNVYKQPNTSEEKLNDLANVFLIDVDIEDLPESQQEQARNLTASIFVLQQGHVDVSTIHLEPDSSQESSGQPATGGTQDIQLPYETTDQGDFDVFVQIDSNGLMNGNETSQIQRLSTHVEGATIGNSTAYLVPNEGLTIVSDIDDILRVTKIYQPKEGLLNSFARPFKPWENMPEIYANWAETVPDLHFHYLTTTPEQATRTYMQYIYSTYPSGSFDTRPLNFSDISATLAIRKYLLERVFETFPNRKFILVADTSNSDVMKDYPALVKEFPGQVQCILLRNTSATDSSDKFPYDTSGFEGIDQDKYMFFVHANDLSGLDIANGQCYNKSVAQNLTFGYQGLPFGIGDDDGGAGGSGGGSDEGSATGSPSVGLGLTFVAFLTTIFWQFL